MIRLRLGLDQRDFFSAAIASVDTERPNCSESPSPFADRASQTLIVPRVSVLPPVCIDIAQPSTDGCWQRVFGRGFALLPLIVAPCIMLQFVNVYTRFIDVNVMDVVVCPLYSVVILAAFAAVTQFERFICAQVNAT